MGAAPSGSIRSVRELVVNVQFDEDLPAVGELLIAESPMKGLLLVDHLLPGNVAVCLNVNNDTGLQKNMADQRTLKGIEIPVGNQTIGRILNALGKPLDGQPMERNAETKMRNIMQLPPRNNSFKAAKNEILETGLRVIDFFTPFV